LIPDQWQTEAIRQDARARRDIGAFEWTAPFANAWRVPIFLRDSPQPQRSAGWSLGRDGSDLWGFSGASPC
jgi:hypothetical protein